MIGNDLRYYLDPSPSGSFISNAIFLYKQIKFGLTWPLNASFVQKKMNYSFSELQNSIPVNAIVNK